MFPIALRGRDESSIPQTTVCQVRAFEAACTRRRVLKTVVSGTVGAMAASMLNPVGLLRGHPTAERASAALIDPSDYGAVGDGVNDDTRAINRAIRVAASSGGVVNLPVGTFLINSSSVRLNSYVTLRGSGYDTVLFLAGGSNSSVVVTGSAGPGSPTVGAVIENLRIDGNKANQSGARFTTGISFWAANDCVVSGVWVENTAHTAIYVAGSRNRVEACTISGVGLSGDNGESGIVFDSDGSNLPFGSVATGNAVANVLEHGIKIYPGGSGSTISGNVISNVGNRSIYVQGASECIVSGNEIEASGRTGILIGGSNAAADSCIVSGNTVRNSASHGILVWGSGNVSVSDGNRVETNAGCGIYALSSPSASVTDNTCVGNGGNGGIVFNGAPDSRITGNNCVGNRLAGICFWDEGNPSVNVVVDSNRCNDEGWGAQRYGILSTDGTTQLTVTNNVLDGNLTRGVRLVGSNSVNSN